MVRPLSRRSTSSVKGEGKGANAELPSLIFHVSRTFVWRAFSCTFVTQITMSSVSSNVSCHQDYVGILLAWPVHLRFVATALHR